MKKENYNMKTKPVKRCREDVIFDTVIFIILTLILFVVAYPRERFKFCVNRKN